MRLIFPSCLLVTILLFASLFFFYSKREVSVVYFNVDSIRASFIQQLAKRKVTDEQVQRASVRLKEKLQKTLTEYAAVHDVVIVDRKTILAGGRDVTADIAVGLGKAMREVA